MIVMNWRIDLIIQLFIESIVFILVIAGFIWIKDI